MPGSPHSSCDFPEERSEKPLPPEEGCFPEEPLPEERFLLLPPPEEGCFPVLPEEPLPPPAQHLPLRVQPELPLTNLPPLDSYPEPLDSDSDCDAETRDSLVVQCSDSDVFERLTWVHHQGDWRRVMTKHVGEIAMNLDMHETMDWLEY